MFLDLGPEYLTFVISPLAVHHCLFILLIPGSFSAAFLSLLFPSQPCFHSFSSPVETYNLSLSIHFQAQLLELFNSFHLCLLSILRNIFLNWKMVLEPSKVKPLRELVEILYSWCHSISTKLKSLLGGCWLHQSLHIYTRVPGHLHVQKYENHCPRCWVSSHSEAQDFTGSQRLCVLTWEELFLWEKCFILSLYS